jgi:hypothetical protein
MSIAVTSPSGARYVGNQGTLSLRLHHIAARRGRRLKRSLIFLPGVTGFIVREKEEENGGLWRMQRLGTNGLGEVMALAVVSAE